MFRGFRPILLIALLAMALPLLPGSAAADPALVGVAPGSYTHTLFVTAKPGDALVSGQRLLAAVDRAQGASSGNRYLIKVAPGVYDLDATRLNLPEYVILEGAGMDATLITGTAQQVVSLNGYNTLRRVGVSHPTAASGATAIYVNGQNNALESLRTLDGPTTGVVIGYYAQASLTDCIIEASETDASTVYVVSNSIARMSNCQVTVTSSAGYVTAIKTDPDSTLLVQDCDVVAITQGTGVANGLDSYRGDCRVIDSRFTAQSGRWAHALIHDSATLTAEGCTASTSATTSSAALRAVGSTVATASNCVLHSEGDASIRLEDAATVTVLQGEIDGVDMAASTTLTLSGTLYKGEKTGEGTAMTCAGVTDETFTFYAATCP